MLSKIRKQLLKFPWIRAAVADYQKRQKELQRQEKWAEYFVVGGAIRRKPKRW